MTIEAAIGYMILAARHTDLDAEMINILVVLMNSSMNTKTEEEAEEAYKNQREETP